MLSRTIYIILVLALLSGAYSCRSKRGPKEYIEKNGLHSDKKPHELAKEFTIGKKQKREYRKQLSKMWKQKHPGEKRSRNPYK